MEVRLCCRLNCFIPLKAAVEDLGSFLASDAAKTRERVLFAQLRKMVDGALSLIDLT